MLITPVDIEILDDSSLTSAFITSLFAVCTVFLEIGVNVKGVDTKGVHKRGNDGYCRGYSVLL